MLYLLRMLRGLRRAVLGLVCRPLFSSSVRTSRQVVSTLAWETKWDALLTLIPGILLLATGVRALTNTDYVQMLEIVCHNGNAPLRHAGSLLAFSGALSVFLGVFRLFVISLDSKTSASYYIGTQIGIIFFNIVLMITLHEIKGQGEVTLESAMYEQLNELRTGDVIVNMGSRLPEAWDHLQMVMMCCGINSFGDYLGLSNYHQKEAVPPTCCTLKHDELLRPENPTQCQTDARLMVAHSLYLHTQGCYWPLVGWIGSLVNRHCTVLAAASFAQAVAAFNAWWLFHLSTLPKHGTS